MRGFVTHALTLLTLNLQVIASKLTPPILPLIVRNPYLSTWLQSAREAPWTKWPMFWTGEEIGLSVLASVPDNANVYPLLGRPQDSLYRYRSEEEYTVSFPIYVGARYDASTTNLTYLIPAPANANTTENLEVVLSFLSPVTPTSTFRQAVPASYLAIYVHGGFDLNVYVDVNGQWVSGDRSSEVTWSLNSTTFQKGKGLKTFKIKRRTEQILTEIKDRAEWGTFHFTGPSDVGHEAGTSALVRHGFSKTGTLRNHVDDKYRSIMDNEPIFAFSKSFVLDDSSTSRDSVLFTFSLIQDPVVQFASARGLTLMKPLWASYFASPTDLLTFHYFDFHNAFKLANNYAIQLAKDAFASGSDDYVDIVALSARQVLGATEFSGTPDNPILFMKEISSNGNFQTIDVIFPSFPFFLYTNPRWLAYLLEPLIEHMLSGQYPNDYAMHDLGTHFPNATGHHDGRDEYMPVEECGNILIMGFALMNSLLYDTGTASSSVRTTTGSDFVSPDLDISPFALNRLDEQDGIAWIDGHLGGSTERRKQARKWVQKSYRLWKGWTTYLVKFSLEPANQLSTDDFAGWLALQTNLALKGILGIKAMSGMALIADHLQEAKTYEDTARDYISKWEDFGISRDGTHAKLAYDWFGSWTTLYNLYIDSLLCFHIENSTMASPSTAATNPADRDQTPLVSRQGITQNSTGFIPSRIYKMQSDWYHYVMQAYGLPLDNRHLYTKSDWQFFAAAVTSKSTREEIVGRVAKWINETATDRPFADLYNTEGDGGFPGPNFFARPVVGGHFAFLTLEKACDGKAMDGLKFLEEESSVEHLLKVETAATDMRERAAAKRG